MLRVVPGSEGRLKGSASTKRYGALVNSQPFMQGLTSNPTGYDFVEKHHVSYSVSCINHIKVN